MKRFKRLGVFLHDSPAEEIALAYAGRLATLADSESVFCIHVHDQGEETTWPELEPENFKARVLAMLPPEIAERTTVEVHEGSGVPEMLRSARDRELDLMIVGRRLPSHQMGIGSTFNRLARKAPCSVLVVPNRVHLHLGRFLVPIDFSEHSKMALETALAIARSNKKERPQVVAQNVYCVGYGYKKAGVGFHEAGQQLEQRVHKKFDRLIRKVNTDGVDFEFICTCSERTSAAIHDLASVMKMDMIVVGSRGVSTSPASLLGGTAERILCDSPLPVLLVKRKGETVHLLDALLGRK